MNISEIVSRIAPEVSCVWSGPVEPGRTRTPANVLIMSAARPAAGHRTGAAAVDRRQRRHSLHPGPTGPAGQEALSQVGSGGPVLSRGEAEIQNQETLFWSAWQDGTAPEPEFNFGSISCRATGVENLLRLARQLDQNQDLEEVLTEEGQGPRSFGSEPRPDPGFLQDDLDFLLDGPTQTPSRTPGRGPTQNRPGSASLCGSGPAGSGTRSGPGSVQNQLEDDWENDDLLNDSLVLEMTQNPDRFLVPKLCSTQNPAGSGQGWVAPSVGTRTEKENQDPTWNPDWSSGSGKWVQTRTEQNRFSSVVRAPEPGQMCSLEPESQWFWSDPMNRPGSDGPEVLGHLDSVFRSEPVWDGPSDDLLCEMCEDLENRIQVQTNRTGSDQRAALQPTHRNSGNRIRPDPAGQAGCSLAAAPVKQPIGRAVFRNRTGSEPSAALRPKVARCFSFRRPCDRVTMATEKGEAPPAQPAVPMETADWVLPFHQRDVIAGVDDVISCRCREMLGR